MGAALQTDERRPRAAAELTLLALAMMVLLTVAGFLLRNTGVLDPAEDAFLARLDNAHAPAADAIALAVNVGFGPLGAFGITLAGAAVVGALARSAWAALRFALLVGAPWACVELVKIIVQRPRPPVADLPNALLAEPNSFSYPSGHTAFGAALGLAILAVIIRAGASKTLVWAAIVLAVVLALGAGWSRLYLGVHHPSDVTASLLLVPCVSAAVATWIAVITPPEHA